jgi:hypothetical protein
MLYGDILLLETAEEKQSFYLRWNITEKDFFYFYQGY